MKHGLRAILGMTTVIVAFGAFGAPPKTQKASGNLLRPSAEAVLVQNCDAHKFETTVQLTGLDGKTKQSKVRMCGVEGQNDADWIRTLKDAVKKTASNPGMPQSAKEQIIAAVNAEVVRLSSLSLQIPNGKDVRTIPKAVASRPVVPLSRDFAALPPLPTASSVALPQLIGPGGVAGPILRVTVKCADRGDEDRPSTCQTIDKDTIILTRADEPFPGGLNLRFVRRGDARGELTLPALKAGQTAMLRLPLEVCKGVVRSKVEIQAVAANAPVGTPPATLGEYDLRC